MKRIAQVLAIGFLIVGCQSAEAQVYGQPYLIPEGFESYQANTMIMYGGYQYVIMPDRTMLLHPTICHDHESFPNCHCPNACPSPLMHHVPVVYETEICAPVDYNKCHVRRRGCH